MSLITCCPACQTMFKVTGDDLRVSDGWVRCGYCDGVFDASLHLQALPVSEEENVAPTIDRAPEAVAQQAQTSQPLSGGTSFPGAERASLFRAATQGEGVSFDAVMTDAEAEISAVDRVEPSPATLRREDRSARPSFVEEPVSYSTHPAGTRSPWRVVSWLFVLVLLWAGLIAGAWHERQSLVQRMPALLPVFDSLCELGDCEMQAPRLLDAVVIDGASMEEVSVSEFKIQLLLKNAGSVAVSLPSLNVTLTGLQGEVLASHIAAPAQFAAGSARLNPDSPLSVAFTFQAELPAAPSVDAGEAFAEAAPASAVASSSAAGSATLSPEVISPVPLSVESAAVSTLPTTPTVSGYRVIAFYP